MKILIDVVLTPSPLISIKGPNSQLLSLILSLSLSLLDTKFSQWTFSNHSSVYANDMSFSFRAKRILMKKLNSRLKLNSPRMCLDDAFNFVWKLLRFVVNFACFQTHAGISWCVKEVQEKRKKSVKKVIFSPLSILPPSLRAAAKKGNFLQTFFLLLIFTTTTTRRWRRKTHGNTQARRNISSS